jgi:hypothetical protein
VRLPAVKKKIFTSLKALDLLGLKGNENLLLGASQTLHGVPYCILVKDPFQFSIRAVRKWDDEIVAGFNH